MAAPRNKPGVCALGKNVAEHFAMGQNGEKLLLDKSRCFILFCVSCLMNMTQLPESITTCEEWDFCCKICSQLFSLIHLFLFSFLNGFVLNGSKTKFDYLQCPNSNESAV